MFRKRLRSYLSKHAKTAVAVVLLTTAIALTAQAASADSSDPACLSEAIAAACEADATIKAEKAQLSASSPVDENGSSITSAQLRQKYTDNVNQKALSVVKDLIDIDTAALKYQVLLTQKDTLAAKLKQAQDDFKTGKAASTDVSSLQQQVNQNAFDLSASKMLCDNAKTLYASLTGENDLRQI